MFSRFNNDQSEQFFQRLNQPLKRMPQDVRAEIHAELRQHLEALIAANEELGSSPEEAFNLALRQFGDPAKVGRKLWWEWFRGSQLIPSRDCRAVLYALLIYAFCDLLAAAPLLAAQSGDVRLFLGEALDRTPHFGLWMDGLMALATFNLTAGIPLFVGWMTSRKFPKQAVKAMFYAAVAPTVWMLPAIGVASNLQWGFPQLLLSGISLAALFGGLGALAGSVWQMKKSGRFSLPQFKPALK